MLKKKKKNSDPASEVSQCALKFRELLSPTHTVQRGLCPWPSWCQKHDIKSRQVGKAGLFLDCGPDPGWQSTPTLPRAVCELACTPSGATKDGKRDLFGNTNHINKLCLRSLSQAKDCSKKYKGL